MKVSDILRVKGGTLYTVTPDETLANALRACTTKQVADIDLRRSAAAVPAAAVAAKDFFQDGVRTRGEIGK